jgi:crossover junction endodeoxyribonuclease RuvC
MIILGIDLGNSGAIAIVEETGELVVVHDMPTLNDGPKNRRALNGPLLAQIIAESHASTAFVEAIGPRPREGVVQSFSFGRAKGLIEGVCAALNVSITWLTPPTWKRLTNIRPGDAKDMARSEAIRRWPGKASLFARVKDDGRAEAALIALAGLKRERTLHTTEEATKGETE